MVFRPTKCLLPQLLQERHIDPVVFYTEIGLSRQHYYAYVTMIRIMSASTPKTVAEYLGVPMDDVYEWQEVEEGTQTEQF